MAYKTDPDRAAQRAADRAALIERLPAARQQLATAPAAASAYRQLAAVHSDRNALLIVMQCPQVTDVKAYEAWKADGRQVRRGARGISIVDEARSGRSGLRWATVFDVSQTDPIGPAVGGREAVWCEAHGQHPHMERPDCVYPHYTDERTRARVLAAARPASRVAAQPVSPSPLRPLTVGRQRQTPHLDAFLNPPGR